MGGRSLRGRVRASGGIAFRTLAPGRLGARQPLVTTFGPSRAFRLGPFSKAIAAAPRTCRLLASSVSRGIAGSRASGVTSA